MGKSPNSSPLPSLAIFFSSNNSSIIRLNRRKGLHSVLLVGLLLASIFSLTPSVSAADSDGDGVPDFDDNCPNAWGNATSPNGEGCMDSDGDGQADWETGVIKGWNLANSEYYKSAGSVSRAVAWNPNGLSYASGGTSGILEIFTTTGVTISVLANFGDGIRDLDYSSDGTKICASGGSSEAYVLNAISGAIIHNLSGAHSLSNSVHACHFSKDGQFVFTGGEDWEVNQYWMSNGTQHLNYSLNGPVYDIDTTPDGTLVGAANGWALSLIRADNGSIVTTFWNASGNILSAQFTPDGRDLLGGSTDNYWRAYGVANQTIWAWGNGASDVYDIQFSSDSSTMIIARGSRSTLYYYDVQNNYSYIGDFGAFGSNNQNRGSRDLAIHPDDAMLLIATRRGRTYLYVEPSGYLQVHGDWIVDIMEYSWQNDWPSDGRIVKHFNSTTFESTKYLCDRDGSMAALTEGHNPVWVDQDPNFSTNGRLDCKGSNESLIEFPIGNIAGAFAVKAGGATQTCIETLGGLSIAQMRWILTSKSGSAMQNTGVYPGINFASVVKDNDGDQYREWSDLDSSCPQSEIILVHRWENRSEVGMLKEQFLCNHCSQTDKESLYLSTNDRPRYTWGQRYEVTGSLTGSAGETLIGYTELDYIIDNSNGIYLVPIIDNWTHSATDALSAGAISLLPSNENVTDNSWPVKSYLRALVHADDLADKMNFVNWALTEPAQMALDNAGYNRLSIHDRVLSWERIGVNMTYLLPDTDLDGVWDGIDDCPSTVAGLNVDGNGCAENQLDDDGDGISNDVDDCDFEYGTATESPFFGCLDSDGDGWADVDDSFPVDQSQWRDQDGDGFGDSTLTNATTPDDCPIVAGNSSMDRNGCPDLDGDGYSDADASNLAHPIGSADAFPTDATQWMDTDSDGIGDNYTWDGTTYVRINEQGDAFINEPTQWGDQDGDGFGDNQSGVAADTCPSIPGTSTENGTRGCIDSDGDGWADSIDQLPSNQWQWIDLDGDGYGENLAGMDADWCPYTPVEETSEVNYEGCGPSERDSDADGINDKFDLCPSTSPFEATKVDGNGCAPSERDADLDGVMEDNDIDDNDPSQSSDSDGDGFGDNATGTNGDTCPWVNGNSTIDRSGCIDSDGDGYSDPEAAWTTEQGADLFPFEPTQWSDSDGDGYGDNWGDDSWNETRIAGLPGEFVIGANKADRCPTTEYEFADSDGCPPGAFNTIPGDSGTTVDGTGESEGESSNIILIAAIVGFIILTGLGFAIAVLLKKPQKKKLRPKPRSKAGSNSMSNTKDSSGPAEAKVRPEIKEEISPLPADSTNQNTSVADSDEGLAPDATTPPVPQTVVNWEQLPSGGEYTNPDADGVIWYQDGEGIHWYQNSDESWTQWLS